MDTQVAAPCNICGASEFRRGPGERLSMTKRLPRCAKCGSFERHRVVRSVFNAIPRTFFEGSRCLQFSPDPALDPRWFLELTVSEYGGDNSLDLQAIALADASYDWVYSSHVINSVLDPAASLKEMLRVVGNGCIVLNVGGTAYNYATRTSNADWGRDKQYMLYGALYADDVQAVLPEVAVLEAVAIDPSSLTLDSVYIASRNAALLTEIAVAAAASNVHTRVFPARKPAEKLVTKVAHAGPWEDLRKEIQAWKSSGGTARFWLRDDDAVRGEVLLSELADLCERERVPIALAVIPLSMQPSLVDLVNRRSIFTPLQHGFDHIDRSKDKSEFSRSEFPEERSLVESMRSIRLGWQVLSEAFGDRALPVFVPPWGRCTAAVQARLKELGFLGYSGSRMVTEIHRRGTEPTGLALASAHVAINRAARKGAGADVPEERVIASFTALVRAIRKDKRDNDEPIGVMTHHWGVNVTVRPFLKRFFDETRDAGVSWVSAHDLFVPKEAAVGVAAASPAPP